MKTTKTGILFLSLFFCLNAAVPLLRAQTSDSSSATATIQPLAPDKVPPVGTFYLFNDYLSNSNHMAPPYPMNPFFTDTNITVYGLGNNIYMVDNTTNIATDENLLQTAQALEQAQADLADSAMLDDLEMEADTPTISGPLAADYTTSTNLWIEVATNAFPTTDQFAVVLHNTVQDQPYDILTTTDLLNPLAQWSVAQTVSGAEGGFTPAELPMNGATNLFVIARYGGSSTGNLIPDWWLLKYFGTTDVDPYALDSSGDGWTILQDYQKGFVPGTWNTPPPPVVTSVVLDSTGTQMTMAWQSGGGPVSGYTVEDEYGYEITPVSASTFTFQKTFASSLIGNADNSQYRVVAHFPNGSTASSPLVSPFTPEFDSWMNPNMQIFYGDDRQWYFALQGAPPDLSQILFFWYYWDDGYRYSSFTMDATNLVNGVMTLPADQLALRMSYAYVQLLGAHGQVGRVNDCAFYDADEFWTYAAMTNFVVTPAHLKENLKFLLRAATVTEPFSYCSNLRLDGTTNWSPHSEYLQEPEQGYGRAQTSLDYEYSGFHTFSQNLNGFFYDPLRPISENFLWRNFVYARNNYAPGTYLTNGVTQEGIWIGSYPFGLRELQNPTFQYWGSGTEAPLPLAMSMDDTSWLYREQMSWIMNGLGDTEDWPDGWPPANEFGISPDTDGNPVLPSGVRNCFGLALNSARVSTNVPISSGFLQHNGDLYANFETPVLATVDYYFARQNFDNYGSSASVMPGSPDFTPTNVSPVLITGIGQRTSIAGWAKQEIVNGYAGKYGYLEQYFDKAYVVGTNGIATTNRAGFLNPNGDFFPTNVGPAALLTMPDIESGARGTGIVNVIKLQVDANHDGEMDLSFGGPDNTSRARPFAFWVDNDLDTASPSGCGTCNDYGHDGPVYEDSIVDHQVNFIRSMRGMEDFARFWICGVPALPANEGYKVTLKWNVSGGNPVVNLYKAADTNGGYGYLIDTSAAAAQMNWGDGSPSGVNGPGVRIGVVSTNKTYSFSDDFYTFPANYFDGKEKHLLIQGAGIGSGELVMTISQATPQSTNVLAQTSLWIDLHDVKDFYERAVITNVYTGAISNWTSTTQNVEFATTTALSEDTNVIVLVHGINVSYQNWLIEGDTVFKRLYWSGYNGKFCAVKWPCLGGVRTIDFNESELYGYKAGDALKAYIDQLHLRYPDHAVHLLAHSQGNAVAGEAIRKGAALSTYILTEGAIPASAYDVDAPFYTKMVNADSLVHTPEWQPMGYRGAYTNFPGRIVNSTIFSILFLIYGWRTNSS